MPNRQIEEHEIDKEYSQGNDKAGEIRNSTRCNAPDDWKGRHIINHGGERGKAHAHNNNSEQDGEDYKEGCIVLVSCTKGFSICLFKGLRRRHEESFYFVH